MRYLTASLFLLGLGTPSAAQDSEFDSVAMRIDADNRLTVTLNIDEDDVPAVVDTAATYFLVDESVLDEDSQTPLDQDITILGIDGLEQFPTSLVGPMRLGNADLGTNPAAINAKPETTRHRTIIPASALPGKKIDFDFDSNQLSFHDRRLEQPIENVVAKVRYKERGGLILIPIKINGKSGRALIDTGSEVSFLNTAFVKKAGARLNLDKTMEFYGTANNDFQTQVVTAKHFSLGPHTMYTFDVAKADPVVFEHLEIDKEPIMLIGMDLLKRFHLQIDRKSKHVLFGRKASYSPIRDAAQDALFGGR